MGAPEYLFIAWSSVSFFRLLIAYWNHDRPTIVLLLASLHLAAVFVIAHYQHFAPGLIISAFTNMFFYWKVKPNLG